MAVKPQRGRARLRCRGRRSSSAGQSTALVKRGPRVRIPSPASLVARRDVVICCPSEQHRTISNGASQGVGDRTTLAVMLALIDAGYEVSVPFGENCRYDLVIDRGATLLRDPVQDRSTPGRRGASSRRPARTAISRRPREPGATTSGRSTHFAVYCRETEGVYLIPIGEVFPLEARTSASTTAERPAQAHPLRGGLRDRSCALRRAAREPQERQSTLLA